MTMNMSVSNVIPRMSIREGARNERSITGALLAGSNSAAVNLTKVLHQDTPYTKNAAYRDLAQQACKEVLKDKAIGVLNDRTNHGARLVEHAINLFVLSKESGVKEGESYSVALKTFEKAVNAYAKKGEKGYSSTCNVSSPGGYDANTEIGKAVDKVVKENPGVFDTAAGMMHEMYLREGLPEALARSLRLKALDDQSMVHSRFFGNATERATNVVFSQLNAAVQESNGDALTRFVNTMLNQLDLGADQKQVKEPKAPATNAPRDIVNANGRLMGDIYQTGGGASIGDININLDGLSGIFNLLLDELRSAKNPNMSSAAVTSSGADVSIPSNAQTTDRVLRRSSSLPLQIRMQDVGELNVVSKPLDSSASSEGLQSSSMVERGVVRALSEGGGESAPSAPTSSNALSADVGAPLQNLSSDEVIPSSISGKAPTTPADNRSILSDVQLDGPSLLEVTDVPDASQSSGRGKSNTRSTIGHDEPNARLQNISINEVRRSSTAGNAPTVPAASLRALGDDPLDEAGTLQASIAGVPGGNALDAPSVGGVKFTSPVQATPSWRREPAELKPKLMPLSAPRGVEPLCVKGEPTSSGKAFLADIASGIQGLSADAQTLKNYIKEGHNPSQAKADSPDEKEAKISRIYAEAKEQSPEFARRVEGLFREYNGTSANRFAGTKAEGDKIITSLGSSTAVTGNPKPKLRLAK